MKKPEDDHNYDQQVIASSSQNQERIKKIRQTTKSISIVMIAEEEKSD